MSGSKRYEFTGELFQGPRGGYYIDFPFDVLKEFGTRKQIKVKIWFDGLPERKSILPKGDGTFWLSVSYDIRTTIGKEDGDKVTVIVEPDLEPRTVELPEDLEWLLDNEPEIKEVFQQQSYSNRKFFCNWIQQSSTPDIRVNRINRVFEWLNRHMKSKLKLHADHEFSD